MRGCECVTIRIIVYVHCLEDHFEYYVDDDSVYKIAFTPPPPLGGSQDDL